MCDLCVGRRLDKSPNSSPVGVAAAAVFVTSDIRNMLCPTSCQIFCYSERRRQREARVRADWRIIILSPAEI